jgi:uncharacterized protein YegL
VTKPIKPITHVLFVTDMSGSMAGLAADVRGGFNSYVEELKRQKAANGTRYRLSVTVFDTFMLPLCVNAKLSEVPALTSDNYTPRGMTALLDAVGKTVAGFDAALGEEDRVLLVIQTDGAENSSREWTWKAIQDLLAEKEATGRWSIVYLGQGRDAWAQGHRFGDSTQTVNTGHSRGATRSTYTGLAAATVDYAAGGAARDVGVAVAATPGIDDDNDVTSALPERDPVEGGPAAESPRSGG